MTCSSLKSCISGCATSSITACARHSGPASRPGNRRVDRRRCHSGRLPAASRVALTLPADCHAVRNGVVLNLWAVAERRVSCATWSTITIRMRANQLLASMPEVRILKTCKEKDGLVVRPPCIEARRSQAMDRGVSDSAPPAAGDSEAWLYRQPDAPGASAQ
jgi:hypothetical protein